ncbi:serine/threonine-protein kinase [Conexibacter woesei]|uniref:serine/threonine-protein kinase n=1 Tax=Conexibacter woesei TaxID=191495 RepID=UPI0018C96264|nr:serine/threonine-protein kinase [Conexibacter woesei]
MAGVTLPLVLDDRFKCHSELGFGTFGFVLAAYDHHLATDVAVKLFDRGVVLTDVLREARLHSQLSAHAHVVSIREVRIAPPRPFVVMRLMPGGSTQARLDSGLVGPLDAVRWVRSALDGLAHAHDMGVLHRDVKPGNLLLNEMGEASLSDFGIAEQTVRANLAVSTYTPHAAPEMLRRSPSSEQTDVWAMGCSLYRLLSNDEWPFANPAAIVSGRHVPVHQHNPQIPLALSRVVDTALARDPADRFVSARVMAEALRRAPVRAQWTREEAPDRLERWTARGNDGDYSLEVAERPRAGDFEVTVRRDSGSGPRRRYRERYATEARALQRRSTLLRRLVENDHL